MKALSRGLLAVLLLGTVTAIAQTDQVPGPAAGTTTGSATAPVTVPMSPVEMNVRAESLTTQMQEKYQQVLHLKEVAKKQKDVIKLSCVNDRLVELKAQMNIADAARQQLTSATAKDPTQANEEATSSFNQFSSAADSVRVLSEQAAACIGEPELVKQESGIEVTRPVVVDDPGTIDPYGGGDPPVDVEPPGYASAFH
jgi:hypothetical protein